MIGCTRCGRWHDDAETAEGRKLTCTEVKLYWTERRVLHQKRYGHIARATCTKDGTWICLSCDREL